MRRPSRCVLIIALICAGCGQAGNGGPQQGGTPEVGVVTIQPQEAVLTAELPGRTSPYEVSDVRPQVTGILKKRLFTEGSCRSGRATALSDRRHAVSSRVQQREGATREREGGADDREAQSRALRFAARAEVDQPTGLRRRASRARNRRSANVEQQQANVRPRASLSATRASPRRSPARSAARI